MYSRIVRLLIWLSISVGVWLIDQGSKGWVVHHRGIGEPYALLPWLNINLVTNRGAAFGLLHQAGGWQRGLFIIVSLVVVMTIIVTLFRMPSTRRWLPLALSLILGGALGNLYDRLMLGYVNDFIDFHIGSWHFATFNVADAAITLGVLLLIVTLWQDQTGSRDVGKTDSGRL